MLAAVLFDLDWTLVDCLGSIRQYAIRFAEDFRHRLVPSSVEHIAEVLIGSLRELVPLIRAERSGACAS